MVLGVHRPPLKFPPYTIRSSDHYNLDITPSSFFLHQRYVQQAGWTSRLRRHIFTSAGLPNARRVLEVGCGTGAILRSMVSNRAMLFGLDIDFPSLSLARANAKHSSLVQGHALVLPYADASFDVSFFHFVLFWVAEPVLALAEARRVTRPGGAIIAFAEPDYSQRKTDSPSLVRLNDVQISSLRAQGANPFLGSRLGELFSKTGIQIEEFGQLDPFVDAPTTEEAEMELKVIQKDIEPLLSQEEANQLISDLRQTGETAWLQVPTYFCWGFV